MNADTLVNFINVISDKFVSSIEGQVYDILDEIVTISPKILTQEPLKYIFYPDKINGIILIANSLVLFYITYYIFLKIISMYNGNSVESVSKLILKTIIIVLLVNNSYDICEEILNLNNIFSESIDKFSYEILDSSPDFSSFKKEISSLKEIMENDNLTIEGIIKSMIAFGSISLLVTFSIRYVTIIFLLLISPLSLILSLSCITRGISKMWGKMLFVNLITGPIIKLILLIPLAFKDKESMVYKVVLLGSMYILYKINNFIREFTTQISLPKTNKE